MRRAVVLLLVMHLGGCISGAVFFACDSSPVRPGVPRGPAGTEQCKRIEYQLTHPGAFGMAPGDRRYRAIETYYAAFCLRYGERPE